MVIERVAGREPLAALLFDREDRPAADAVADLAVGPDGFSVLNSAQAPQGSAELLRDGLTFDLTGLAPAPKCDVPGVVHRVALPGDFDCDALDATWFMVGPHLAGAENLLPVLRVAAAILRHLTQLPGLQAIVWRPARIAMSPAWFSEAVGVWLAGGPFPALALTALARHEHGIESEGLGFLTGQEFLLHAPSGGPNRQHSRIAVRLTDWLVTHGPVDTPQEVVLAGVGAVWIEPEGNRKLNVEQR
ncbi:hypothetical protein NSE01_06520 [Novosphingobium sediminis]|uniref:Uncharacterized protein n=1 Tax=Novosphingobium sediminis TaxID=707214 RepID=A0A512AGK6_9SPHN|nr:hypothetical protein NSE01_06520 [Novosphingobium sediminis]